MDATTIAVDLAKHVFEVACVNEHERVLSRHRLTRAQFERFLRGHAAAEVVMEACATSHHWGRTAQAHGHHVTLLPPQYVRPFVRRQKTDRTDVVGLLDAQRSAGVKAVPVKTVAQQELLALHRLRRQWVVTRTARINAVHGLLGEFGICFAQSARRVRSVVPRLLADAALPIPGRLRRALAVLVDEVGALEDRIATIDRELQAWADEDVVIQRLLTIPGVGLLTATALVGTVGHIQGFTPRRFASWLGLTPREHSSGMTRRLGGITKQGDVYLRSLLVHGARAVLAAAKRTAQRQRPLSALQQWALAVATRRGSNRAAIGLANKLARVIWVVWVNDVIFERRPAAA